MDKIDPKIKSVVLALAEIGAIKTGDFLLKSGERSPLYVDMRLVIGYPEILILLSEVLWSRMASLACEQICGVPYSALPLATAISIHHKLPLCMRRKERKQHGTGRLIEGVYREGDRVIVIEDVVTSGQSTLETVRDLREEGLVVHDIVCFLDREAGSKELCAQEKLTLHAAITLQGLLGLLHREGKLAPEALAIYNNSI